MKTQSVKGAFLDKDGLPTGEGIYLAKGIWGSDEPKEIDVYLDPLNRLSVLSEDYGGEMKFGINDSTDCHIPVENTGLEFISKIGDLK